MRGKKIFLLMAFLGLLFNLFPGNILNAKQNRHERTCFLTTSWDQEGEYAKYSPDQLRVGCWSLAIAQIAYYHRLQPHGHVSYKCSTGYVIDEDLNYPFTWKLFVRQFDANTPPKSKEEVAKYIYSASLVIQKDFGTERYVEENNPHWLDEHYDCKIRQYDSPGCSLFEIQSVIMKEIDSKRPVLLNIKTLDGKVAHAVVIDGYREENDNFLVHIVWGANGAGDDWYDFFAPIQIFDNSFRRIVTFKPD